MERDLLAFLAVGADRFLHSPHRYPYPDALQFALNQLSNLMLLRDQPYPQTLTEVLQLFERPLKEWWPLEDLPSGIDPDFPLIDAGDLDEQISEFLESYDLSTNASLSNIQMA